MLVSAATEGEQAMKTAETEFTRKAYAEMLDWKQRLADRYALLVEGARRTGKTHLVSRFAKAEYDSHVFIDFSKSDRRTRDAKKAFEEHQKINCKLGDGIINMPEIIKAADAQGVKAYIVEREYAYTGDPYTTILEDFQYLSKL